VLSYQSQFPAVVRLRLLVFIIYFLTLLSLLVTCRGSVQCVASVNFYTKLLYRFRTFLLFLFCLLSHSFFVVHCSLIFIVPIIAIVLVSVIPYAVLVIQDRLDYSDNPEQRRERRLQRRKIIKLVVFALFLSRCLARV
jgi:hypothetical protein